MNPTRPPTIGADAHLLSQMKQNNNESLKNKTIKHERNNRHKKQLPRP